jgi:hypothetical protein
VVTTALGREAPDAVTRPLLDLLRTWQVHRFGADVALGGLAPTLVPGPDDIALSDDG